jgi:hypothetical protein
MASNLSAAKNAARGPVGPVRWSGRFDRSSGNRPPLVPFGGEQMRRRMRAAGFEPATLAL